MNKQIVMAGIEGLIYSLGALFFAGMCLPFVAMGSIVAAVFGGLALVAGLAIPVFLMIEEKHMQGLYKAKKIS